MNTEHKIAISEDLEKLAQKLKNKAVSQIDSRLFSFIPLF